MSEPHTIVVKEIRIGGHVPPVGATHAAGGPTAATPGRARVLRGVLAVVVACALLLVIVPLGLLAIGCVALVACVGLIVWGIRRAFRGAAAQPAAPEPGPFRENVRVRTPNEA